MKLAALRRVAACRPAGPPAPWRVRAEPPSPSMPQKITTVFPFPNQLSERRKLRFCRGPRLSAQGCRAICRSPTPRYAAHHPSMQRDRHRIHPSREARCVVQRQRDVVFGYHFVRGLPSRAQLRHRQRSGAAADRTVERDRGRTSCHWRHRHACRCVRAW